MQFNYLCAFFGGQLYSEIIIVATIVQSSDSNFKISICHMVLF